MASDTLQNMPSNGEEKANKNSTAISELDNVRNAWGWIGLNPVAVVAINAFGNVIVRATDGAYWRICPEEWSCTQIAGSAEELAALTREEQFQIDWEMSRLVEIARQELGQLSEGRCYCLKIPAIVGGSYEASNLGTISIDELITFSGVMAKQTKGLPDGSKIVFKITP